MKVLLHDLAMNHRPAPTDAAQPWAVLLAAGSASRMGYRPKCLLERDGTPLLVRLLQVLHGAGVAGVVLVLGHHAGRIAPALDALPGWPGMALHRVLNPDPQAAQDASLRLGLQAVPATADAVLVLLADQPLLDTGDVHELLDAWRQRPAGIGFLQPVHQGRPGHPVVLSAPVATALAAAAPGQGGRQWQAAHAEQVLRWAVPHARFSTDVDHPDDLLALRTVGVDLRWPDDLV